jgi:hypothetical protein
MAKASPISKRQRALWEALNSFIQRNGGWVTSQPDCSPIRFECPINYPLPTLLEGMGYTLAESGTAERLLPIDGGQIGPTTVAVWVFDLPPF